MILIPIQMEKCFIPTVILLMLFLKNERVIALGGGGGRRNEDDTHQHHDTHRLGWGGGVNFILFLASFRIFATES